MSSLLDIIIPVLNEEKLLTEERDHFLELSRQANLIFVDGGSEDRTVSLASQFGDCIQARRGRAFQKNEGARFSRAEALLFLHADSFITPEALEKARAALQGGAGAGCFRMVIDDKGAMFRLYERIVNFRAGVFGVTDGDLGLFIKRHLFFEAGQFDELPVMEDLLLAKKLKKMTRIHQIDETVRVSSRRWREHGFVRTFFRYWLAYIQLWTGIPFFRHTSPEPQSAGKS